MSSLFPAAKRGFTSVIRRAVENNPELDLNSTDQASCTLLHHAAREGHLGLVNFLLEVKLSDFVLDINKTNQEGLTALQLAERSGHTDIVNRLKAEDRQLPLVNEESKAADEQIVKDQLQRLEEIRARLKQESAPAITAPENQEEVPPKLPQAPPAVKPQAAPTTSSWFTPINNLWSSEPVKEPQPQLTQLEKTDHESEAVDRLRVMANTDLSAYLSRAKIDSSAPPHAQPPATVSAPIFSTAKPQPSAVPGVALEDQLAPLLEQVQRLSKEMVLKDQEMGILKLDFQAKERDTAKLHHEEVSGLRSELANTKAELQNLVTLTAEWQRNFEPLQENLTKTQGQNEVLRVRVEELTAELSKLKEESTDMLELMEMKDKELAKVREPEYRMNEIMEENRINSIKAVSAEANTARLVAELVAAKEEQEKIWQEKEDAKREISALRREVMELNEKYHLTDETLQTKFFEQSETQRKLEEAEKQVVQLQVAKAAMEEKKDAEVHVLVNKHMKLEEDLHLQKTENTNKESRLAELKREVEEAWALLSKSEAQLQGYRLKTQADNEGQAELMNNLQSCLAETKREFKKKEDQLKEALDAKDAELAEKDRLAQFQQAQIASLESDVSTLKYKKETAMVSKDSEATKARMVLEGEYEIKMAREVAKIQDQLNQKIKELSVANADLDIFQSQLARHQEEVDAIKTNHQNELAQLTQQMIDNLEKSERNLQNLKADHGRHMNDLRSKYESEMKHLERQMQVNSEEAKEEMKRLRDETDERIGAMMVSHETAIKALNAEAEVAASAKEAEFRSERESHNRQKMESEMDANLLKKTQKDLEECRAMLDQARLQVNRWSNEVAEIRRTTAGDNSSTADVKQEMRDELIALTGSLVEERNLAERLRAELNPIKVELEAAKESLASRERHLQRAQSELQAAEAESARQREQAEVYRLEVLQTQSHCALEINQKEANAAAASGEASELQEALARIEKEEMARKCLQTQLQLLEDENRRITEAMNQLLVELGTSHPAGSDSVSGGPHAAAVKDQLAFAAREHRQEMEDLVNKHQLELEHVRMQLGGELRQSELNLLEARQSLRTVQEEFQHQQERQARELKAVAAEEFEQRQFEHAWLHDQVAQLENKLKETKDSAAAELDAGEVKIANMEERLAASEKALQKLSAEMEALGVAECDSVLQNAIEGMADVEELRVMLIDRESKLARYRRQLVGHVTGPELALMQKLEEKSLHIENQKLKADLEGLQSVMGLQGELKAERQEETNPSNKAELDGMRMKLEEVVILNKQMRREAEDVNRKADMWKKQAEDKETTIKKMRAEFEEVEDRWKKGQGLRVDEQAALAEAKKLTLQAQREMNEHKSQAVQIKTQLELVEKAHAAALHEARQEREARARLAKSREEEMAQALECEAKVKVDLQARLDTAEVQLRHLTDQSQEVLDEKISQLRSFARSQEEAASARVLARLESRANASVAAIADLHDLADLNAELQTEREHHNVAKQDLTITTEALAQCEQNKAAVEKDLQRVLRALEESGSELRATQAQLAKEQKQLSELLAKERELLMTKLSLLSPLFLSLPLSSFFLPHPASLLIPPPSSSLVFEECEHLGPSMARCFSYCVQLGADQLDVENSLATRLACTWSLEAMH